jgi:hypothetical protein
MAQMVPGTFDYREVPCPRCGAKAGSYCIRPSGHSGPIVAAHKDRREAAQVVWSQAKAEPPAPASPVERPATSSPAALALSPAPGTQLTLF